MCHKNRGPRCSNCHKPAPYHRCRCPARYAPNPSIPTQHDGLPTYAAAVNPQPRTMTLPLVSAQPRCEGRGYRGCGYRRRNCPGPIHLLVSLVVRKVQEKKERERVAATLNDERDNGVQERGVIGAVDETVEGKRGRGREEGWGCRNLNQVGQKHVFVRVSNRHDA